MSEVYEIIYKATNTINGKVYIGQTVNSLDKRMYGHFERARSNKNNKHFYSSLNKYGKDSFIWETIDKAYSKKELDEKEIDWIWFYNSTCPDCGYNISVGGHSHQKINIHYAVILFYKGMTLSKIAKKLCCERNTVSKRLKSFLGKEICEYKITKNRPKQYIHKISKSDIQLCLDKNISIRKMSEIFKMPKASIKRIIIGHYGVDFYNNLALVNKANATLYIRKSTEIRTNNKIGDIEILLQQWFEGKAIKKIAKDINIDYDVLRREFIKVIGEEEYKRRSYFNSRHIKVA